MTDPIPGPGWREKWLLWRNRWLGDPRFQHWSMRLPLLRRVASHHANAMFGVITGFVYTKTLTAVVDAGIISGLARAPAATAALAAAADLSPAAMARLLAAAQAIDLVTPLPGDRWTLGQRGAALANNSGALAMIEHHKLFYDDLADPLAMLRQGRGGGKLADFWSYAAAAGQGVPASSSADPAAATKASAYSALMAASQPMVAEQVLAAYDFGRHRRLLDVGGGHGAFVAEVAARHPGLDLAIFDLPPVVETARGVLAARGLARVEVHGGSFRDDPLPPGADLVSLVRILHDHDDAVVQALLAKIHAALPPGGRLIVAEPMAGTRGAEAMGDAYFGLYLWAMGSGRPRTAAAYRAFLEGAGFRRIREQRTALPMVTRLLVADR
ncbi:methyltransferase [Polymorphobacter fuscus]|uniref:Methyltransferase domain-containing protein n=1 Tax=Sandarakinorhabdus fusca TaxID=1439888 RepID=A0A7C9GQB2_9SPHN|nr:methyltransferase [Polymorphobacter fuscus]KAB7644891.1 methyltransferase domain-containing protein [Polymorphobacter fuscus]MQT18175.1 methyltransferase domain-containing protein [Polymorphobacter fuscus]NJC09494.1 demethylspheroidene O-methyltransferase [Polymorphobacter fuscus]